MAAFQNGWVAFGMDKSHICTESAIPRKSSHQHYIYILNCYIHIPWLELSLGFMKHLSKIFQVNSHPESSFKGFHKNNQCPCFIPLLFICVSLSNRGLCQALRRHRLNHAVTFPLEGLDLSLFCSTPEMVETLLPLGLTGGRGKFGIWVDGGEDWMHSIISLP